MAIKTYKPVTNGRRNMTSLTYEEITTNKPEKSLVAKKSKNGGRNNQGVITTRHQMCIRDRPNTCKSNEMRRSLLL